MQALVVISVAITPSPAASQRASASRPTETRPDWTRAESSPASTRRKCSANRRSASSMPSAMKLMSAFSLNSITTVLLQHLLPEGTEARVVPVPKPTDGHGQHPARFHETAPHIEVRIHPDTDRQERRWEALESAAGSK